MLPPERTCVLIIGGGPAGSTAASFLAQAGIDVTVLEREHFPRYHIGESLLPSCLEILDLVGARSAVEAAGFRRKPGAYLEWGAESWTLDFGELRGEHIYSFQVERSRFDQLLLQHSSTQGARVFEGVDVSGLDFDAKGRPISARWVRRGDGGAHGAIGFSYLIDASGRYGVMATRYMKNRKLHRVFQNVALWGYWSGAHCDAPGYREGAIAVGSIPDGWLWSIPLTGGQTSIGVVMHKSAYKSLESGATREQLYRDAIASCPLMSAICAPATLESEVRLEQDYSYASEAFSDPGVFLCGDAACFLDPLLSTGVHLAMLSAMLASAAIASSLRGEVTEARARSFFEQSYRQAYVRFLAFVSAFYNQRRGKHGYFAEAQRLSHYDVSGQSLKQAFLNLVSGLEDLSDAEAVTAHLMGEVSRRVSENLDMRRDKQALAGPDAALRERAAKSVSFFDAVEGISSLSPDFAIDGLYVAFSPRLRLAFARPETKNEVGGASAREHCDV